METKIKRILFVFFVIIGALALLILDVGGSNVVLRLFLAFILLAILLIVLFQASKNIFAPKRIYYQTRSEAEKQRRKGDRIFYEDGKGYYIVVIKNPLMGR